MFGAMLLTLYKVREPAFAIIALIGVLVGYCVSESDPLSSQAAGDSLLSQIVVAEAGEQPLLTSSFFALAISAIMAIFTGASEIPRDIDSGMIMVVLSKPLKRSDYMLGKYFGVLAICLAFFIGVELVVYFAHLFKSHESYGFLLMARQMYLAMALLPLVAATVLFSCFLNDLAAMILTSLYILFSLALGFIPIMVAVLPKGLAANVESYLFIIYYFFPNFIYYFQTFKLFGLVPASLALYSAAVAAILLVAGSMRLQSRDLSPNA